jgi:hypothetical protein
MHNQITKPQLYTKIHSLDWNYICELYVHACEHGVRRALKRKVYCNNFSLTHSLVHKLRNFKMNFDFPVLLHSDARKKGHI